VTTQDSTELCLQMEGILLAKHRAGSSQTYTYHDSRGDCYSRTLSAADLLLTNVENGHGCW